MPVERAVLPEHKQHTIIVGTSVRKRADVLVAYLQSLAWQELPPNVALKPVFVPDGLDADAQRLLADWTHERGGELLRGVPAGAADFTDVHPVTHQWSAPAMARVGANKDKILRRALELGADAVVLADADLILDRTTIATLMSTSRHIVTAAYWTYWHREGYETRKIHAAPQIWLKHPYELNGRGMEEWELRQQLIDRQLFRVPGYGACTLISRQAIEAGCSFAHLPDVPLVGLMAGEDRHFCLRAERLHVHGFADGWPDVFHVYHLDEQTKQIPEMLARLGAPHPIHATLGNLVALKLQPLEPVPHQAGWTMVEPQFVRGRLGQLVLMPEIEEAVYDIKRTKDRIVPVHFSVHHEIPYYRGKRRLVRVTLVDCKQYSFAPVVDSELFVGPRSGRWLSTTDHTEATLSGMKEAVR